MSIRFIYGRAGSGKSTFCLEEIKKRIDSGESSNTPLFLIVPEQFSFQGEKNLLETIGERGIFSATVLSFKRLSYKVLSEVGGLNKPHINDAGKVMLLRMILEELKKELKLFNKISKEQGFSEIISSIIAELKRYDVFPTDIFMASQTIKDDEELRLKLMDIGLIYEKYENKLHEKYIDSDDDLIILNKKFELTKSFNGAEIWIDEFTSFIPAQYDIIEKLLKKAKRVNITMCGGILYKNEYPQLFNSVNQVEKRLLELAEKNNINYEEPIDLNKSITKKYSSSEELSFLERNLFVYPFLEFKREVNNIKLYKGLNAYGELENVASEIIKLVRDSGYRYRDIAILCRNIEDYEKLVQITFREYGIPYFIDSKREIDGNPLIVLISSVLEIKMKNWSYDSVFKYLKTGLTGIDDEYIDLVENYVLTNGIKGNVWYKDKPWINGFKGSFANQERTPYEEENLKIINETRLKIIAPLIQLFKEAEASKDVRGISVSIFNFLISLNIKEKLEAMVTEFRNSGNNDEAEEFRQIWSMVIKLFDQLVDVLGEEKIGIEKYAKIFNTGISEYQIGVIPSSLDQVLIGSMERVKSHNVSVLFVIGMNDGVIPKNAPEEGLLSDKDRITLKEAGIELATDTKSQILEEQFIIYESFTIPKEKLYLSYPMADSEGKTLRPSLLVARIKKMYNALKEESDIVKGGGEEEALSNITVPEPTFTKMLTALRNSYENGQKEGIWLDTLKWYYSEDDWKEKSLRAIEGILYNNNVNHVKSSKIKKLYKSPLKFSVSRVQKFVDCPFSYYVQYGLKATERKIHELSYPDIGTFMHKILDEFSATLKKENLDWKDVNKDWCGNAIDVLVEKEITEDNILKSSERYRYYKERMKKTLKRAVWTIVGHVNAGSFKPYGHEIVINENGDIEPLKLTLPSGDVLQLIGRVDRADEMEDGEENTYIRIIDYKSGSKSFKLSDVYYGLQLQLLVYLDLILTQREKYENKKFIPGGILYFKIEDPMIAADRELSDEELEQSILKKLKMNGLLLEDAKIIKGMDQNIEGYSLIIPARMNKDGSLGNSSVASIEQFQLLRDYVRNTLTQLSSDMLDGNISIKPYKKKDYTPCENCKYGAICRFDLSIPGNSYRILKDMKDEEVWELIKDGSE